MFVLLFNVPLCSVLLHRLPVSVINQLSRIYDRTY